MSDPLREPQPATDGTTFGKAAAEDDELVDELLDETGGRIDVARERFEARSAEQRISGAHPPSDANDRAGKATSFTDHADHSDR
jgi:hypothetical protein